MEVPKCLFTFDSLVVEIQIGQRKAVQEEPKKATSDKLIQVDAWCLCLEPWDSLDFLKGVHEPIKLTGTRVSCDISWLGGAACWENDFISREIARNNRTAVGGFRSCIHHLCAKLNSGG